MPHRVGKLKFGAAVSLAAIALAACSTAGVASKEDLSAITAKGVGRVSGVPDTLVMTLGVETEAAEASAALTSNNEKAASVIAILKQAGIAEEDIQTSQFSIQPRFDEEGRNIVGYLVNNLLTARVAGERDAGGLIDAAAKAAGNEIRVQSVSFEIDDKGPLFEKARADAVARAKEQATQLADAAGVKLGAVRSITESSTAEQPPSPFNLPRTGGAADLSVPFQSGSQEVTLEVQVVYDIA